MKLNIFDDKVVRACSFLAVSAVVVFCSWNKYNWLTFAGLISVGWLFKSAIIEIKKDWDGE